MRYMNPAEDMLSQEAMRAVVKALAGRFGGSLPISGHHFARRSGRSLDFADLRSYTPGDDPRTIDYKVLARTDRAYVRRFHDQTALAALVVVDGSGSMQWGERQSKYMFAAQVAATLAYGFVARGDTVSVAIAGENGVRAWRNCTSLAQLPKVLELLTTTHPSGMASLGATLNETLGGGRTSAGVVFVISDLLLDYREAIGSLGAAASRGWCAGILHVLAPEELSFARGGLVRLRSAEFGSEWVVPAETLRRATSTAAKRFVEELVLLCWKFGVAFLSSDMSGSALKAVLDLIEKMGVAYIRR